MKKNLAKKLVAFTAMLALIVSWNLMGTWAYFSDVDECKGNVVSTGDSPCVMMYASVGPRYWEPDQQPGNHQHFVQPNFVSKHYDQWLDAGCDHIIKDLTGTAPEISEKDGEMPSTFKDINDNRLISRKLDISCDNYNWNGTIKDESFGEMGSFVHYIAVLENGKRLGVKDSPAFKINKLEFIGTQTDVLVGQSGNEYKVSTQYDTKNIISENNEVKNSRARGFTWNDSLKKYEPIQKLTGASEPDLIIYDCGSDGYYSYGTTQQELDKNFEILSGLKPHGEYIHNKFNQHWAGPTSDAFGQMGKDNYSCALVRTEYDLTVNYKGVGEPYASQNRTIYFGDAQKETPSNSSSIKSK